ncbi:hypothetical protein CJF42_25015 [Pseudoalteromonas sp. NBT06-2]|uniref:hypothetical protein n=1 Tax=Pseudoalteromonas sp. NBT06-2 TaxID=2025950 RepID=UPI000BA679D0|nr:hypothetical protein [Pseudoalteromonas sp. NBT06-2]PAJ71758.1 hypothetical protein CJF42_25015 [Pseudoalteromonas sp. NBT06-2]
MNGLIQLRLSNGADWDFRFKAASGEDIKQAAARAFRAYRKNNASEIFQYNAWLNQTKREINEWYENKSPATHPDLRSLDGTKNHWLYEASQGRRYGKQQCTPVNTSPELELHVENPEIENEWICSDNKHGLTPKITMELKIIARKNINDFSELYCRAYDVAMHAKNLSGLSCWISEQLGSKSNHTLKVIK